MEAVKLSSEDIRNIALFESITGAVTKDCVLDKDENKIIFIVKKGDMGLAIGKKGASVKKVKQTLGRKIEVLEHSEDPAEFLKNLFSPYRVTKVDINSEMIARVGVDDRDKTSAIGLKGKNLQKIKALAKRHHDIRDVVVT